MAEQKKDPNRERILENQECREISINLTAAQRILGDIQDEVADFIDHLNKLRAKCKAAEADGDRLSAEFWALARKECREWFREQRDANLCIRFERIIEDGETVGVKLIAFDPQEEMAKKLGKFYRASDQ
jgi:hypothetical protein